MKYCKQKIKECAAWVEEHGWYLDTPIGASQKEFCKAMCISADILKIWEKKSEFSEAIAQARTAFRKKCVGIAYNSLLKRVQGYDVPLTSEEAIRDNGGKLVTKSASRRMKHIPPDVGAIIFMLTNMDPDNWKNRRDGKEAITIDFEEPPVIMFGEPDGVEDGE